MEEGRGGKVVRRIEKAARCAELYAPLEYNKRRIPLGLLRLSLILKLSLEVETWCGERGIRTPGTLPYNGFQDRRIRPLCHFSEGKGKIFI